LVKKSAHNRVKGRKPRPSQERGRELGKKSENDYEPARQGEKKTNVQKRGQRWSLASGGGGGEGSERTKNRFLNQKDFPGKKTRTKPLTRKVGREKVQGAGRFC